MICLSGHSAGGEVCYDRIGCFTNGVPWASTLQRPIAKLPWSPETINVRFLLFTKSNPNNFQEVNAVDASTISASNFGASRKTRFIIHGYSAKAEDSWPMDMCKAMLESQFNYNPANIHVIGHSLGAHAAGEAGKRSRGIARITGGGYIKPGSSYTAHIDVESNVGPLNRIKFVWNNDTINPLFPTLGASSATIQYGKDGKTSTFCSNDTVREEVLQTLNPC
ncbi:hypothetical protein GDO78_017434 [Eleutherodactylus coqui]|uniref:Triacylglycerol lipase n=1 Tax=Eleutherodactylus coqui TaxID=57060 RepID=A0A8J6BQW0_ELECQ|nr:hypothetical protein GDO78_017434 [Eleutherodactylus coqui]